jgi:hypothetical protein
VALVIGIAVVLFVLALVSATVIAGLVQIVREKVREKRSHRELKGVVNGDGPFYL